MERRAMGLLEISLAPDALAWPPGSPTGMTVGADIATPHSTGGTILGPHLMKEDAEPEKHKQHQHRDKQIRYHGKAPSLGGETGLSYMVCGLLELSTPWRYTTRGRRGRLAITHRA